MLGDRPQHLELNDRRPRVLRRQVIARLDPQNQLNALRSAQANLASAEAVLTEARLAFGRQQALVTGGWTPRAKFDEAQQALLTAQAQVDAAQAQARIAQDQRRRGGCGPLRGRRRWRT